MKSVVIPDWVENWSLAAVELKAVAVKVFGWVNGLLLRKLLSLLMLSELHTNGTASVLTIFKRMDLLVRTEVVFVAPFND